MPQATFVLKEPTSKDQTLVYLLFRFSGSKLKFPTSQKINPKFWNPESRRAREVRGFKYSEFNSILNHLEAEVSNAYRKLINDLKKPTPNHLRSSLNSFLHKDLTGSKDLISHAKYIVESTDRSKSTKKQLKQAIRTWKNSKQLQKEYTA